MFLNVKQTIIKVPKFFGTKTTKQLNTKLNHMQNVMHKNHNKRLKKKLIKIKIR